MRQPTAHRLCESVHGFVEVLPCMQVAFDSQMHELKQLLASQARLAELRSSISGLSGDLAAPNSDTVGDAQAGSQLPTWTPEEVSCMSHGHDHPSVTCHTVSASSDVLSIWRTAELLAVKTVFVCVVTSELAKVCSCKLMQDSSGIYAGLLLS